jgi:diadenosine tetraphosphate (Ap4A) HIT family hydrolase
LCAGEGGELVARNAELRIVRADEAGFPAFYRVVWNRHVREFSDLDAAERQTCMQAVALVEEGLRAVLQPLKINIASLGNAVPHLHWHVVARFGWDSRFPSAVWAPAVRAADDQRVAALAAQCTQVDAWIARHFDGALPAPKRPEAPAR